MKEKKKIIIYRQLIEHVLFVASDFTTITLIIE